MLDGLFSSHGAATTAGMSLSPDATGHHPGEATLQLVHPETKLRLESTTIHDEAQSGKPWRDI